MDMFFDLASVNYILQFVIFMLILVKTDNIAKNKILLFVLQGR